MIERQTFAERVHTKHVESPREGNAGQDPSYLFLQTMFYNGWFAATQWQWLLSGIARGRSRARCIRLADRLTRIGAHFCPIRVELLSHATEKSNMFVVRKINIQQFDNRLRAALDADSAASECSARNRQYTPKPELMELGVMVSNDFDHILGIAQNNDPILKCIIITISCTIKTRFIGLALDSWFLFIHVRSSLQSWNRR